MVLDPQTATQPLTAARTLPGAWYRDAAYHAHELDRVFQRGWIGVAVDADIAGPGSYLATTAVGNVPLLIVRDDFSKLRAFLNVCRHRGAPVAEGCGRAQALACTYHGWVYRLDGALSRAAGVGAPEGFALGDHGLFEIRVATFARNVFVNLDGLAPAFDPGPWAGALDPYDLESLVCMRRDRFEVSANWKLLLENTAERYHDPFVHPQHPTTGTEHPTECSGAAVFTWDRPQSPTDAVGEALWRHRPGSPGWARVAERMPDVPCTNGAQLTLFPNTVISLYPGFATTMRFTPTSVHTTIVEREYLWADWVPADRRERDYDVASELVQQDVRICEAQQRSFDGGLSPQGMLSTSEEHGLAYIHALLRAAVA
jgi:phenylpropionate dioxygenase-like ring-hydroxylating dioxygenase large terminal subunit